MSKRYSRSIPTRDAVKAEREARLARLAELHLSDFIRQAWPIIEPGAPYLSNWHIDAICEYLEAVTAGDITRLLINMPPRYMKSIAVSVMWPVWEWLTRPSTRFMFASYSGGLATEHSLNRRTIIQSDWYQRHWGDRYKLSSDANLKTEFKNNKRGQMTAVGFKGTATGKGGDRVVIDDPHDPQQAESELERETGVRTFRRKFSTRLNNKKTGAIVVVMQRLHEEDVSAVCLELGYVHLCLPAIAEKRTIITLPRSGREIVREEGDLLWPEREGPEEIAAAKKTLGSYGFAGQYQQRPSPTEGGMLKRHWWRFWRPRGSKPEEYPPLKVQLADGSLFECQCVELPEEWDQQIQSWDMTFKDAKSSDYVVGQVWGQYDADIFLLDQVRGRMDFSATQKAVIELSAKWPDAFKKLVEEKANGAAVISSLKSKLSGLIPVNPQGGKASRVSAAAPAVESGNVHLPHPNVADFTEGFIEEAAAFPNGANDDQVDTFTQAEVELVKKVPRFR